MDKLNELITCPVCLDTLTDPVTIPDCGHSFCRNCLIATQEVGWTGCEVCLNSNYHIREALTCHYHFRCPVCRKILSYSKKEIQSMPTDKILSCVARAQYHIQNSRPIDAKKVTRRQAQKLVAVLSSRSRLYNNDMEKKLQRLINSLNSFIKKSDALTKTEVEKKFYHLAIETIKLSSEIHTIEKQQQVNHLRQIGRRHEARPANPVISHADSAFDTDAVHINPLSIFARLLEHHATLSPWPFPRFSLDHFFGNSLFRPFPFRFDREISMFDDFDFLEAEMNRAFANIPFWTRL